MKLLLQSAMIFFATLMTAAVVALGEPAKRDVSIARSTASYASHSARPEVSRTRSWSDLAAAITSLRLR